MFLLQFLEFTDVDNPILRATDWEKYSASRLGDNPIIMSIPFRPDTPDNDLFDHCYRSVNFGMPSAIVAYQQGGETENGNRFGLAFSDMSGKLLPDYRLPPEAEERTQSGMTILFGQSDSLNETIVRCAFVNNNKMPVHWISHFKRESTAEEILLKQVTARALKRSPLSDDVSHLAGRVVEIRASELCLGVSRIVLPRGVIL